MTIGDDDDEAAADSPEAAVEHMLSGLKQFGAQKSDYRGASSSSTDDQKKQSQSTSSSASSSSSSSSASSKATTSSKSTHTQSSSMPGTTKPKPSSQHDNDDDDDEEVDDEGVHLDVRSMLRTLRGDMRDLPADVLSAMQAALPPTARRMLERAQALGTEGFRVFSLEFLFAVLAH
jgi:DNA mismatch repair ATPase MutL